MLLEKMIRMLKGNPNYKWESNYSLHELFTVSSGRAVQLLRGSWKRLTFKEAHGLQFIGSHVKIVHPYLFTAGENLIVDDNTYINALSSDGICIKNNVSFGRNCTVICTGVIAQKGKGICIGNNTGINANTYLAGQGGITIEDNVIIGPGVRVFSENHNYADLDIIIKEQGVSRDGVYIKNDCWIGAGVTILAGVTIGEGCVIAAGSVVTKSMPPFSVVAGVPARVIKSRKNEQPDNNIFTLNASA